MSPHIRKHDLRCIECGHEHTERVATQDLPGGVRYRCPECEAATVHVYAGDSLHPKHTLLSRCIKCGKWSGYDTTRAACRSCTLAGRMNANG